MAIGPKVTLLPLSGVAERRVQEAVAAGRPLVEVTSALLADAVAGLDEAQAEDLAVGERAALLLELRRATLGEQIPAVAGCPACGELLDLTLAVGDLLATTAPPAAASFEVTLTADDAGWRARLRRVSGADQRAVQGAPDPAAALLGRCVLALCRGDGVDWPVADLSPALAQALERALQAADPMAEIRLELACPTCGHGFLAPFDPAAHFVAELSAEADLLLDETARIARGFHWSEAEIMALPRTRRRAYAALASPR